LSGIAPAPPPEAPLPEQPIVEFDTAPTGEREAAEFSTEEERQRLRIRSLAQYIRERRRYAIAAYRVTRSWVCFLITISVLQLGARMFGRGLETAEFIAVVTSTTASVFGFWWLVGRYLFATGVSLPERPPSGSSSTTN
jgi:cytosine/uracil/thiamine/allantoin permease